MSVTVVHYNFFKKFIVDGTNVDLDTNTIKVALCGNGYTPDIDTHDFFNDITNELSGGGYSAGGNTLANAALTVDTANDRCKFDADDVSFTSLTATNVRYAIIYKDTGTASTSPLIAYVNFGADNTITDGTLTIAWHNDGITLIS